MIKPFYDAWPVGFAYVLACLEKNNILYDFIDVSYSFRGWKNILNNNNYFAVATGGLIGFYRYFQQLKNLVYRYRPDIPFILGGNITKDSGNSLLFDRIGIDFGIIGEAETSLPELIYSIKNKENEENYGKLPGIIYKNNKGNIIRNHPLRLDLKKENIIPAWHSFDVEHYIKASTSPFIGNNLEFMPVLTGRGCVGKCAFCSPSIGGFRKRPIEHVLNEIEYINSKYDFKLIIFYNEMFYPTAKEIKDFCNQYRLLKNKKPWIAQVRVDSDIDVETFLQMKDAGCIIVSAGIESGSDSVLNFMNKKVTSLQVRTFFRNSRKAKMPANGTFIVGHEGEKEEDLKKTIDLVIDEEINTGESLIYVYPGTDIYNNALKKGLIRDEMDHLEKATKNYSGLFVPNVKENFLNISDIPDSQFLNIATREVRRYHTFVFNRYTVQNLKCRVINKGMKVVMLMKGICYECGSEVSHEYSIFKGLKFEGFLGQGVHDRLICQNCFKQLSYNAYSCSKNRELKEHLLSLKEKFKKLEKVIICGINDDAMFLMRINLFALDYNKILGFLDLKGQYKSKYYINYPVFNINNFLVYEPDGIIILNCTGNDEKIIKNYYKRKSNLKPPEFIYLVDDYTLGSLRKKSKLSRLLLNTFSKDFYFQLKQFSRTKTKQLLVNVLGTRTVDKIKKKIKRYL